MITLNNLEFKKLHILPKLTLTHDCRGYNVKNGNLVIEKYKTITTEYHLYIGKLRNLIDNVTILELTYYFSSSKAWGEGVTDITCFYVECKAISPETKKVKYSNNYFINPECIMEPVDLVNKFVPTNIADLAINNQGKVNYYIFEHINLSDKSFKKLLNSGYSKWANWMNDTGWASTDLIFPNNKWRYPIEDMASAYFHSLCPTDSCFKSGDVVHHEGKVDPKLVTHLESIYSSPQLNTSTINAKDIAFEIADVVKYKNMY